MKKRLTPFNTFLIASLFFFTLEFFLDHKLTFLGTTNLFFFPAGFFLITGLFSLVLYSGSFDFFHYSIRKAALRFKRQTEEDNEIIPLSKSVGSTHRYLISLGTGFMLICLLALIGYYLFEQ